MAEGGAANASLITAVLDRDGLAWRELVDRYHRLVWHVVHHSDVDARDREDVVQIVFLRLAERLHTLRDPSKLTSFVAGVARYTSWETARRSAKDPVPLGGTEERLQVEQMYDTPETETVRSVQVAAAVRGLGRLSPDCQHLLRLFFGAELSTAEVAEVLDVEPGTVRVRKSRCLDHLRRTPEVSTLLVKEDRP